MVAGKVIVLGGHWRLKSPGSNSGKENAQGPRFFQNHSLPSLLPGYHPPQMRGQEENVSFASASPPLASPGRRMVRQPDQKAALPQSLTWSSLGMPGTRRGALEPSPPD